MKRAETAEEVAAWGLSVAAVAIEDADYAVLETIAARLEAEDAAAK